MAILFIVFHFIKVMYSFVVTFLDNVAGMRILGWEEAGSEFTFEVAHAVIKS